MRVLMLGWEFPPFIAGGLGTACYGLTKAMADAGHEVLFALPRRIDRSHSSHVTLLTPNDLPKPDQIDQISGSTIAKGHSVSQVPPETGGVEHIERVQTKNIEMFELGADFSSPYKEFTGEHAVVLERLIEQIRTSRTRRHLKVGSIDLPMENATGDLLRAAWEQAESLDQGGSDYGSDLMGDAQRYALLCVALASQLQFDVIHAHDWLTYPAGMAVRAMTGKPLVVQVHATEFDRSGEHINQQVYDIERAGVHGADRVIAVSQLTKNILTSRYGVEPEKVDVVYNGVMQDDQPEPDARIEKHDKIVLFLGRITMQKGPEYFIRAAKRVLEKIPNAKFVVAGSGDGAIRMINEAAELGIGQKVLFTGFLRGRDVKRIFDLASCYVMPSVSEPFGIAALEAMHHDTPVIISKQSGVSEVLTHALKVDFWDTDEMANKIVAVLKYPPLSQTLREHGGLEVRGLTWDGASEKCVKTYARAIASQP
jgi:glycogen synthase